MEAALCREGLCLSVGDGVGFPTAVQCKERQGMSTVGGLRDCRRAEQQRKEVVRRGCRRLLALPDGNFELIKMEMPGSRESGLKHLRHAVQCLQSLKLQLEPQGAFEELNASFWTGHSKKSLCEKVPASYSLHQSRKPAMAVSFSGGKQEQVRSPQAVVSRRDCLLFSGCLAGALAVPRSANGLSKLSDLADDNVTTNGSSLANANGDTLGAIEPRQQPPEDAKSWYRYRGEGFVIRVPPGYEDVLDYDDEEDDSSLYNKRAKDKPFLARFASPDRDEVLSIVVKPVSRLRLSFFETTDITDFGSIKEAAPNFVPAGAKLISARIINSKAARILRTYYMYEFLLKGMHFMLSAGVSKGRVFVLGASTPQSKWKDYGNRLQLASSTFYLP